MKLRIVSPFRPVEDESQNAKCLKFVPTREYDAFVDDDMEEASFVCNGDVDGVVCPRRYDCLIFALLNNEHYGMWGGLYPEQRHDLRQRYKWKRGRPIPSEWTYENATPQQDLLDQQAAREAEREASRLSGDQEGR